MQIRDRIQSLLRVPARELRPNPRNWRTHPPAQQDALRGILAEVGYADALLARELDDGTLELIDGHLRAELTPDALVPVLVLDVTAEEADKLLAALDPLAAMAGRDDDKVRSLLADVETDNEALRALLAKLASADGASPNVRTVGGEAEPPVPESYTLLVECQSEADQQSLFDRLTTEGYTCRVLSM